MSTFRTPVGEQQKSTILIAGCGYVGRRAAEQWVEAGHVVYAITRTADKARDLEKAGIQPVLLDLSNPAQGIQLPSVDTVLWAVGFDRTTGIPRDQIWLDGLSWLIANLTGKPQRIIYVSSTSVYGSGDGTEVDERSPIKPITEGGKCCVQAEQRLRRESRQRFPDIAVRVLRFAGIYGPDRLLRRVEQLRSGNTLPGNPDHPLNLIHVDDAIRVIEYVRTTSDGPDLLNVVNAGTISRQEYYRHLADLVDAPAPQFDVSPGSATRGGNRIVVSCHRPRFGDLLEFDDVRRGIEDAVRRSRL